MRRHVIIEYDDEAPTLFPGDDLGEVLYAYALDEDGVVRRLAVGPISTELGSDKVRRPGSVAVPLYRQGFSGSAVGQWGRRGLRQERAEGTDVIAWEGRVAALDILRQAADGQARVDDEIDKLVPESSEDPEACDRDCELPGEAPDVKDRDPADFGGRWNP